MINSLSGRFLILTTIFVMLAEILIFVPSVARFREDYLLSRLERAQIASLALLADDMISDELEAVKRLAARHQPLDCLASLWEKIGRLSAAVDGLNLDHTQALAQILTAMAATPKKALPFQRKASSLDSDLLGERHAIG